MVPVPVSTPLVSGGASSDRDPGSNRDSRRARGSLAGGTAAGGAAGAARAVGACGRLSRTVTWVASGRAGRLGSPGGPGAGGGGGEGEGDVVAAEAERVVKHGHRR